MEITAPNTANQTCDWPWHYGWDIMDCPSYSPDLIPSDFHVFGPQYIPDWQAVCNRCQREASCHLAFFLDMNMNHRVTSSDILRQCSGLIWIHHYALLKLWQLKTQ